MNPTINRAVNTAKTLLRNLAGYNYPTICDISYAQADANMNWSRIKELGIGIIMRGGQANYEDALFRTHYNNAVKYKVPFGIYWFFQPNMDYSYQLTAFMRLYDSLSVKPKQLFIDVEPIVYPNVSIYPPSVDMHSYWLMKFLKGIEDHTKIKATIYTRADYWDVWVKRSGKGGKYCGDRLHFTRLESVLLMDSFLDNL